MMFFFCPQFLLIVVSWFVQPGVIVPSEVIKFMLHLKVTVGDHKASVFVEMQQSIQMNRRSPGRMWPV
jgi:hypothetical protein